MSQSADLVIAVDSSTTACKAIVWDRAGRVVAEGRASFALLTPHPGWYEQHAADWWTAAVQALREAAARRHPLARRALARAGRCGQGALRHTALPPDHRQAGGDDALAV